MQLFHILLGFCLAISVEAHGRHFRYPPFFHHPRPGFPQFPRPPPPPPPPVVAPPVVAPPPVTPPPVAPPPIVAPPPVSPPPVTPSPVTPPPVTTPAPACPAQSSSLCCKNTSLADTPAVTALLGLLGVVAPDNSTVGLTCRPLSLLGGITGSACDQSPVCCTGNNFSGVVVLGCSPLKLL